jgi:hypothetical protein
MYTLTESQFLVRLFHFICWLPIMLVGKGGATIKSAWLYNSVCTVSCMMMGFFPSEI